MLSISLNGVQHHSGWFRFGVDEACWSLLKRSAPNLSPKWIPKSHIWFFWYIMIRLKVTTWLHGTTLAALFFLHLLPIFLVTCYPQVCLGTVTVWHAHSPSPVSTPGLPGCPRLEPAFTVFYRYHPTQRWGWLQRKEDGKRLWGDTTNES